ncbi:hypothetical protein AD940_05030 [Gluconobacter thailandicus]|nr:hypothetical protein AD940_05030 [Gluconobacter thailandicus]
MGACHAFLNAHLIVLAQVQFVPRPAAYPLRLSEFDGHGDCLTFLFESCLSAPPLICRSAQRI